MSVQAPSRADELDRVLRKRFEEAIRAGIDRASAARFALADVDVGELRRLVEKGCPPQLLAQILL